MSALLTLAPFKALIQARCGLRFENRNEGALRTALRRRQEATGIAAPEHYHARLQTDEEEFHTLVNLLTINETYFYREANHLRLITEHLIPRLLPGLKPGRPLRILSAGCSTGEEPYSVAIALAERFGAGAGRLFELLAGDIDRQALATAEEGVYGSFSFRALHPELRQRYFDAVRPGHVDQWRIKPPIREMPRFFRFNLLGPQTPKELAEPVDIILYRNISIYFDRPIREVIMRRLLERLSPRGHLIVGNTETFANDFGLLPQVVVDGSFFFSLDEGLAGPGLSAAPPPRCDRPVHAHRSPAGVVSNSAAFGGPPAPLKTPKSAPVDAKPTLIQGRERLEAKRYAEALVIAEALIAHEPVEARLLAAYAKQHLHDHAGARVLAEAALDADPWRLDALLLLGNLARLRNDPTAAIRYYKQAVYHRPECWEAHYLLGETFRRDGQNANARREYQVLQRQLAGTPPPSALTYFRLTATPQELARLVEVHLARLAFGTGAAHGA